MAQSDTASIQHDEALTEHYERDPVWGPNSYPALATIEDGAPPWKDHAYLAFWDQDQDVYGFFHWNSSPNHPTTKAQLNLSVGGQQFDLREELPARSDRFVSESIDFDLKGSVKVTHPEVQGDLTLTARRQPINFGPSGSIPKYGDQKPLQHFQHPLSMTGTLTFRGKTIDLNATGYRTRTWGYRDDSVQFPEYYYLWATFDNFEIAVIKHLHPDGVARAGGGLVDDNGVVAIREVHIPKDAAGFAIETRYELADGRELIIDGQERLWSGWCPIGLPRREGPTFAAFDEILRLRTSDGKVGFGQSEYGYIRRVH
ncbi:DUF7065 domain-containing protein [Rhodococcus wratislaviensis]|uniref:DUF7065 domain-containing protein n=1 Tax=Rhodococcus wratislaviensis TaxID=44752 RepID=UPI00365CC635